jgi:thiol-disulfide isomerase/thioredoxin
MTSNPNDGSSRRLPLALILGGLFTVLLILTVFLTLGDDDGAASPEEYGDPTITGENLPTLVDAAADPAIGMPAPEVAGADFQGDEVSITDDGNAKIIVFLAHWCPHCQNEVPVATDWLETTDLPANVGFYSVATGIDPAADNFPPSEWLDREGWPAPVIVDDASNTVGNAFGLNAYPFWVAVNADGTIFGRTSGEIGPEVLDALTQSLSGAGE